MMQLSPLTADALGARHGFFTREGGVSSGIYAGLQCGWGASGDDRAAVAENRLRAARALGAEALSTVYQVHSADAVHVQGPFPPLEGPRADAAVADRPGLAVGVLTADCGPVLLADPDAGVVGAAHAGWRGAFGGVLEATLALMERLGAKAGRVRAALGPTISQPNYEVGPEFVERFLSQDAATDRFFGAEEPGGKRRFDLPAYVEARLTAMGVASTTILGRCTYAEPTLFYSARRAGHAGEPDYGRLLSAIVAGPAPTGPERGAAE